MVRVRRRAGTDRPILANKVQRLTYQRLETMQPPPQWMYAIPTLPGAGWGTEAYRLFGQAPARSHHHPAAV